MPQGNSLVCFTNCVLALEDGSLVRRDLWVDEYAGVILDAQKTFFDDKRRPNTTIDLGGDILSPGFIDVQINGAYGFDFSVFDGDAHAYEDNLKMVAKRILETGVTSFLPTIITQQRELYPKLLALLKPSYNAGSASVLGFHAEGPFLQPQKRGAHMSPYLLSAPAGFASFEEVYGSYALRPDFAGVRVITAAPEIEGVIPAMEELSKRGVICSIGHSIASSDIASAAVLSGARLITHLFNAMPQLHHRDPSIIGLLGASSIITTPPASLSLAFAHISYPALVRSHSGLELSGVRHQVSEALSETITPPQTPAPRSGKKEREDEQSLRTTVLRPYYGIIVDGVHSHPYSVRLAYTAHQEGCILITDAMPLLDPHLKDGIHPWRDGICLVKEGVKLYVEGTSTLAGSVVSMDICVRNFASFTGCGLGKAIKCATYNPAACLNIAHRKGTLRPGADADLVLLDATGRVRGSWVLGKKVWPVEEVGS